jgi:hypothetical protein
VSLKINNLCPKFTSIWPRLAYALQCEIGTGIPKNEKEEPTIITVKILTLNT